MAMADFLSSLIHVAGLSHQQSSHPSSGRSFGHLRSLSSVAASTSPSSSPAPVTRPEPQQTTPFAYITRHSSEILSIRACFER